MKLEDLQLKKKPNETQLECLKLLFSGLSLFVTLPTGFGKSEMIFMWIEMMALVSYLSAVKKSTCFKLENIY